MPTDSLASATFMGKEEKPWRKELGEIATSSRSRGSAFMESPLRWLVVERSIVRSLLI